MIENHTYRERERESEKVCEGEKGERERENGRETNLKSMILDAEGNADCWL